MGADIAVLVEAETALVRQMIADVPMPTHKLAQVWVALATIDDLMRLEGCPQWVVDRAKAIHPAYRNHQ